MADQWRWQGPSRWWDRPWHGDGRQHEWHDEWQWQWPRQEQENSWRRDQWQEDDEWQRDDVSHNHQNEQWSAEWASWNDQDASGAGQVSSGDTAVPSGEASVWDDKNLAADSSAGDRDVESSRGESRKPRTGKEHVPSYDGESEGMREYTRRVKIYSSTTGTDPEFRAGRLLEQLTGRAWRATETLDLETLRQADGVEKLLQHLWQELEPLEHLRTFQTLQSFYRGFKRNRGEEFVAFDTRFRVQLQRLEEIGAPLTGTSRAFWFLETAGLSSDLRKQVVAAAGGAYEYTRLRDALMAIVPQVIKDEETSVFSGDRKVQFQKRGTGAHKVHMVEDDGETPAGHDEDVEHGPAAEGEDPDDDEAAAEALEREAKVLMTQAAKRRSTAEKARGFKRVETDAARSERIAAMKARMPCSECKARGKVVYGHWHNDPTCSFYQKSKNGDKSGKKDEKDVFVVSQTIDEDEDSGFEDEAVYAVMMVDSTGSGMPGIAMCDTCCAKTVAGVQWMEGHMKWMDEHGVFYHIVEEKEAFRFGPGGRIHSDFAVVMPMYITGATHSANIRVSVVSQNVPLLMSKNVLQGLGAILYLKEGLVEFQNLGAKTELMNTSSGHVGFSIVQKDMGKQLDCRDLWHDLLAGRAEVLVADHRTRVDHKLEHPNHTWEPCHVGVSSKVTVQPHVQLLASVESECHPCEPVQDVQDGGPKDQGRVRHGHCGSVCRDSLGVEGTQDGPPERDLEAHQASKDGAGVASWLEESRSRHPGAAVPGFCGAGSRAIHGGPPLARMEEKPVHPRVGALESRQDGRTAECDGPDHGTNLPSLPVAHDSPHESPGQDRFLRLCAISKLPGNIAAPLRRTTHRSGAEGNVADREDQAKGHSEGYPFWKRLQRLGGKLLESSGWDGCPERRSQRWSNDFHESLTRGSGADPPEPRQQELGPSEPNVEELGGTSEKHGEEAAAVPVLREASERRAAILAGQRNRKIMRQGVARRLLGNAKRLVASVLMVSSVLAVCSSVAASVADRVSHSQQPDVVEIVAGGHSEVTLQFSRWGWRSAQPVDLLYGQDLWNPDERARVVNMVRQLQPRLAVLDYPCFRINAKSSQEKRRLRQLQHRERPFLQLCEEIFDLQLAEGRDALGKSHLLNGSLKDTSLRNILHHPEVHVGVGHGCRFGVKNSNTNLLLHHPTLWFSTSKEIRDELSLRCKNEGEPSNHVHGKCFGGKAVFGHDGGYTPEMAAAIHRGFVKTMKRKHPSHLHQVLRGIHKQIKFGSVDKTQLRWSEKSISRVLKQWQAVYAVANPVPEDSQEGRGDADVRSEDPSATTGQLNDENIRFEVPKGRKLDSETRAALRKLHCSLGHPHPRDFERFLRLGGSKKEILEASTWLKCSTCEHSRRPKAHRQVSIPPNQCVFGDEVCIDCFHVHDTDQQGHWFLSIVDRATCFHMIGRLEDHSPQILHKTFDDIWCRWAGVPNRVSVDCEGGFGSDPFWKQVGEGMTSVVSIAGKAHWQAGKVERHNQTIKRMMESVIRHGNVKGPEDMDRVGRETVQAKNELVREHGWSPNILVFGKEPRAFGEIHSQGNPAAFHPNAGCQGTNVAKRVKYRFHARLSFLKSQVRDMLGRTLEQRTRKLHQPEQGQLVFFWREARHRRKQNPASNWMGPGFVVGVQGTNAWVSCGGRCFLVAGEHIRLAVGDETEYGTPEAQQALALFRRPLKDQTYEDLTGQNGPGPQDTYAAVDDQFLEDILNENIDTHDQLKNTPKTGNPLLVHGHHDFVPKDIRVASRKSGWCHDSLGNPIHVRRHAVAFDLPSRDDGRPLPRYRTTWVFTGDYVWKRFEDEVEWDKLDDPGAVLPETLVSVLVTLFTSKRRKEWCLESVPVSIQKKQKTENDHEVLMMSRQKAKRMYEKEIPYHQIPIQEKDLYKQAETKEWTAWTDYDTVEELSKDEAQRVLEKTPERVLRSRWVYRNKHAGMYEHGSPLPTKAKARLCVMGQFAPGVSEGTTPVDSPTVQRVSTLYFLNCVLCWGWTHTWALGDVSNAFLQGERPTGDDLYMFQPERGIPGVEPGAIFRLKKSVYGLCDAPKMWYESLCKILTVELPFEKSLLDPALFVLYDKNHDVCGLLITHVDDIMFATNGSEFANQVIEKLHNRLPFGEWKKVRDAHDGVSYCGKELRLEKEDGKEIITLSQRSFVEGRLEEIEIDQERKKQPELEATQAELTDFRSTVGSLQWLATQSRPDLAFEVNQLQKRVPNLQVADLIRANRTVREAKSNPFHITIRDIGKDWDLCVFHDAGLFNSVGVEIDEQEADDVLFKTVDKKLVYSQKGAVVGFVRKGNRQFDDVSHPINLLDWKSSTNKRVIESSFSAETQAALMGQGLGKFVQALSAEVRHGSNILKELEDDMLEEIQPMIMVTDCKSLYDAVHKQAQHVSDKGSIISLVLIRQICEIRTDDQIPSRKAQLVWVPTHCQLADCLTKGGRGRALREANWHVKLRGESLKNRQSQKKIGSVWVSCWQDWLWRAQLILIPNRRSKAPRCVVKKCCQAACIQSFALLMRNVLFAIHYSLDCWPSWFLVSIFVHTIAGTLGCQAPPTCEWLHPWLDAHHVQPRCDAKVHLHHFGCIECLGPSGAILGSMASTHGQQQGGQAFTFVLQQEDQRV